MNVWVEPLDWEPPKGEAGKVAPVRPIKQIVVSAASFYGNFPAKGGRCVGAMDQTCKCSLQSEDPNHNISC